jgi:hypothetical protein
LSVQSQVGVGSKFTFEFSADHVAVPPRKNVQFNSEIESNNNETKIALK